MNVEDLFFANQSPYMAMFQAGIKGIPFTECVDYCTRLGLPLREKDARAYSEGANKRARQGSCLNPIVQTPSLSVKLTTTKLADLPSYPYGWTEEHKRWFPCTASNTPMQKWGYKPGSIPTLHTRQEAIALSQTGLVGQNLYAQPIVVIDIDGVGHGDTDTQAIQWGRKYSGITECWENPAKQGSFHLYFTTDRKVPIGHYPYAKIDLMGNATNAAVYTKEKQSNGLPRILLTDEIWLDLQEYIKLRKEQQHGTNSRQC